MWTDRRWLFAGLAGSLLINVFLVGVLAGHSFERRGGPPPHPDPGPIVQQRHLHTLPPDERKKFNQAMASHRPEIREARQEVQRLRRITEADIAAETFDRDKVAADFKAVRDASVIAQQHVQEGLVEGLAGLSQASRTALVAHEDANAGPPGQAPAGGAAH